MLLSFRLAEVLVFRAFRNRTFHAYIARTVRRSHRNEEKLARHASTHSESRFDPTDPASLRPEQRLDEVAAILAAA
jgi:hypothetical protein